MTATRTSYVVDTAALPWRRGETEGITFRGQIVLSGDDGGPEAFRFMFDPCPAVYAHMHLVSQFQVLLGGSMDLPREATRLRPIGAHYTDHARPYGPFSVAGAHDVLVLHPRKGGLVPMSDKAARRRIHLTGRELSGNADAVTWHGVDGQAGVRRKFLFGADGGPSGVLTALPPHRALSPQPAPYGRYDVVIEGSMIVGGKELGPPGLRYVRMDEEPEPLVAGSTGATVASFSFDQDVLAGGLGDDDESLVAEQAMSKAL